jgi:cytochrome oxidase assembly protein ShyY1
VNRRLLLSVLGLCLALGFAQLGRWQLSREDSKRQQLAAADAALAAPARDLAAVLAGPVGAIDKVEGRARFTATPRLWLDNQRRGQQVGMRLYCAATPVGGGTPLLVDLGWLPVAPDRSLPAVGCPAGEHALAGLLVAPPSVGLRLGPGLVEQDGAWLATRLDPAEVSAAWASAPALADRVLRLDPAIALGHARDLELLGNTLPPEKHRGYAVQWFGLAVATLIILLVLNLRRRP